ncbi:MAG: thiamine biosynthesis protein ThiF [Chloroflexi bacterium]|jgi:PRTRC genetic system ThiF family protein|nr:thiamine biosynthesis protein ThiF [Chloroflexota bacterium]
MQTLDIEPTYRVVLPALDELMVMLVGVGGTGSALAPSLARLAYQLRGKGVTVKQLFVDPDTVETKNVGRQQFCPAEVGANKAECLAFRLNAALGLDITAIPAPFAAARFDDWTAGYEQRTGANLLISAVDNHLARREIAKVVAAKNGRWYGLDLGNERHSGQALLGNITNVNAIKFDRLGLCTGLPSPYVQEPALLEPPADAGPLSCADLTLREEQSPVVNQQVAALAAHYAYQFLISRELTQMATTFTLESAVSKSYLLTKQRIAACSAGR